MPHVIKSPVFNPELLVTWSRDQILLVLIGLMFVSAFVEVFLSIRRKNGVYNLRDSLSNLSMGLGQQAVNVVVFPTLIMAFDFIQKNFGIINPSPDKWLNWVVLVLMSDFLYYLAHRTSHRVNLFVAAHIGHHQVEDYNHVSAWRQSWSAHIFVFPFFIPLALIGFKVEMFMLAQLGIMFIQFFSHNGTFLKRLGVLEYILVTPRGHRVHHGTADKYLDKNCGGMFIIWDRLFGSYAELEEDHIELGILGKMNHFDPVESNTNYFKRIAFVSSKRKGLGKLSIWLQTPETLGLELKKYNYHEEAVTASAGDNLSAVISLVVAMVLAFSLMGFGKNMTHLSRLAMCTGVIFMLWQTGLALSGKISLASRLSRILQRDNAFERLSGQNKAPELQK